MSSSPIQGNTQGDAQGDAIPNATDPATVAPTGPATHIDEVLSRLTRIIADSQGKDERTGYFAALYYKVTARVKDGIARNEFEDGARMEKLDVTFANRYLAALEGWQRGVAPTGSWSVALDSTKRSSVLVLQHLLLGVNAHINLDLAIATVETVRACGQSLSDIRKDYDAINAIIGSLTYEVINEINRVSPLLSLLGLHGDRPELLLIQFSIGNARDGAWCFAEELDKHTGNAYAACIVSRDGDIAKLAGALIQLKGFIRLTLWLVHVFEWKNPGKIIRVLDGLKKTFIRVGDLSA
ncbi:MAG TPA: DUF5995 family protein [Puia sp.]|nr:DUF5995 family protein [Puia sp.]